ncbi:hypothetical protein VTO42DRAFT_6019 [Malbranchea cinnamomea]
MAFPHAYFANGTWGLRTDISEILARNRNVSTSDHQRRRRRVPGVGLLSRTVVHSPMIQWVVPARIRRQGRNDVVFVGENFIQIKELVSNRDLRYLVEVTTKTDFDAKIIGAKAITVRSETSLEEQMKLNAQGDNRDIEVAAGINEENLPAQILVLVLSSKELLFTYAVESADGRLEFVYSRRPLPADVSSLEEYGRHISVDPKSRAMAISAAQKFFGVFALKPPSLLQPEMKKREFFPIVQERFFRVEGDILMMDFLYPTTHDGDRVILLLLVSRNGETHIVCYDWNSTESLRLISINSIGRLPQDCSLPSVLIPLKTNMSFLLVCRSSMLVFKNILEAEGSRSPARYPLANLDDNSAPGRRLWTFWARPMRNPNRRAFDDIFLCREDGKSLYLEIGAGGELCRQSQPGQLGCNVDTAFAIIDGGFEAGDLLLALGSTSGGGLFIADARQPPRCVQRIANWAPLLDSVILQAKNSHGSGGGGNDLVAGVSSDRLFACSGGSTGKGSITELRYGIEARIGFLIEQEDISGIMDLWGIPNFQSGGSFLLFSDPIASSMIAVPVDAEEIYEVDEESSGLDLGARTLAVTTTTDGVVIQVTTRSVNLVVIGNAAFRNSLRFDDPVEHIIAAVASGKSSLFAAAIRKKSNVRLEVWKVSTNEVGIQCCLVGEPILLSENQEPVCLTLAALGDEDFLFIGTGDGKILVGSVNFRGSICLSEHEVELHGEKIDSTVCESMALITTIKHGSLRPVLFCGLRSGNIISFSLQYSPGELPLELKLGSVRKLGDTPVRIRTPEHDPSFAVTSCGAGLWQLSSAEHGGSQYYHIEKVWFTDQNNPARVQSAVDVFNFVEPHFQDYPGGLDGSFICITKNQLLACTLEKKPKPVPRHIPLSGIPRRLIYSDYLKRLVVGYYEADTRSSLNYTKRTVRPRVAFIDPDDESLMSLPIEGPGELCDSTRPPQFSQLPTGASGEKVTSLFDWQFNYGDKAYHMIIVGTSHPHGNKDGRLIYITARPSLKVPGNMETNIKYIHLYELPVRAVAAYKPSSLVVAVEDEIILQALNPETKRWRKLPAYKVESSVVSVTVREPYIYVLTSRHSLCVLKVNENHLSLHGQDGSDREGLDHVNIDCDSPIAVTSNRGGTIVGLTDVGLTQEEKLLRPVFAAHIPLSVVRLTRSLKSPVPGTPQVMYGTTIDGSVYRFTTLGEKEWRLLRFIQNLCLIDPVICPFSKRRRKALEDLDLSRYGKPESMHINGDILSRLVSRGFSHLKNLIQSETIGNRRPAPIALPTAPGSAGSVSLAKMRKFSEYSRPIVGDVEDPYAAVLLWMEDLLRIRL